MPSEAKPEVTITLTLIEAAQLLRDREIRTYGLPASVEAKVNRALTPQAGSEPSNGRS